MTISSSSRALQIDDEDDVRRMQMSYQQLERQMWSLREQLTAERQKSDRLISKHQREIGELQAELAESQDRERTTMERWQRVQAEFDRLRSTGVAYFTNNSSSSRSPRESASPARSRVNSRPASSASSPTASRSNSATSLRSRPMSSTAASRPTSASTTQQIYGVRSSRSRSPSPSAPPRNVSSPKSSASQPVLRSRSPSPSGGSPRFDPTEFVRQQRAKQIDTDRRRRLSQSPSGRSAETGDDLSSQRRPSQIQPLRRSSPSSRSQRFSGGGAASPKPLGRTDSTSSVDRGAVYTVEPPETNSQWQQRIKNLQQYLRKK